MLYPFDFQMTNTTSWNNGIVNGVNCSNLTKLLTEYFNALTSSVNSSVSPLNNRSESAIQNDEASLIEEISQRNAVIYIVVVLFFYSFGIGIMMIKYMRKEAKEQEEFKVYQRYITDAHEQYVKSTNRGRLANRLALQALNMVNAIPQTTQEGSKVTFV